MLFYRITLQTLLALFVLILSYSIHLGLHPEIGTLNSEHLPAIFSGSVCIQSTPALKGLSQDTNQWHMPPMSDK